MKRKRKITGMVLAGAAMMLILTGCDNERTKNQEAYRQYGINCIQSGDYEEAVDAFQRALNQSIGTVGEVETDLCFYKAEAQFLAGDYEGAETTYNALIEYNGNPEAYFLRGELYFAMGDSEKGAADYATAVNADSDNYELYIGIYESLAAHDMTAEGEEYLEKGLAIEGDEALDDMQRGRIYLLRGQLEDARKSLESALEKGSIIANYYLAQVYDTQGDAESAESCVQAYLEKGDVDSVELCTLGDRELEQEDYAQALLYYDAGLDMDTVPNKQALMRKRAVVLEYLGDFAAAREQLDEYLEEYPSDEAAARERIFLETR